MPADAETSPTSQGEWIPAACWHNCGGRCLNVAHVVEGTVLRLKTDDTHPDSADFPQQRGCLRGRSQRKQVFGVDRLKYPMRRKHWTPGGGGRELRGVDEWVRISWDEALDAIAAELKRIKRQFGNESILALPMARVLAAYGGGWESWGMVSTGAWPAVVAHMAGRNLYAGLAGAGGYNDRLDLQKARLVVLWGANPAWSSQGNPTYLYQQAKRAGAKFICVDPRYTATAASLADQWIPVRPGTDCALLLGMAHHMIEHGLQDQAFLDAYTVGFDRDHMPPGADPDHNFHDYVMGTLDGVPKTPEWASAICGTDPELIKSFAQELATVKPATILSSYAPARTYRGEQFAQAFLTVGWMTGNVGEPGAAVADCAHVRAANGGPALIYPGRDGVAPIPNPVCQGHWSVYMGASIDKAPLGIVCDEIWDAVLGGEFTDGPRGKRKVDIRMIWCIGAASRLNQYPNLNRGIDAFRAVEFVVSSGHFFNAQAKYSDIVLPATTEWEKWGTVLTGNREMLIWASQITEPLFEAKDDSWIEVEIGKRLGIAPEIVDPIPLKQRVFNCLAGAKVIKDDGSGFAPLLSISQSDLDEFEVTGTPQQGRVPIKELRRTGIYQVKRTPGDTLGFVAYQTFRDDPLAHPLKTPTGKLHIFSQPLADDIRHYGWTTIAPIAEYAPAVEGFEDTFRDPARVVKSDYPLQFITPHDLRRAHSVFDNVQWLRRAWPQGLSMNPLDAAARGLKTGDIVKVTSRHGAIVRPVQITPHIIPGVVALGEGAWVDRDDKTGIDRAGATNSLSGSLPCGQGVQPWNTGIVQVTKFDAPLPADYTWPQRIPLEGQ